MNITYYSCFISVLLNNYIYFIITLLSLDPIFFACNPYGRWLFLKSGFYIPVFCEQYRRYFRLVFVDFGVCCSWDYMLSKSSPACFFEVTVVKMNCIHFALRCWWLLSLRENKEEMIIIIFFSLMSTWSVDDNHHHYHIKIIIIMITIKMMIIIVYMSI